MGKDEQCAGGLLDGFVGSTVKERHKQRYKALVTNAGLAIKADKLKEELEKQES